MPVEDGPPHSHAGVLVTRVHGHGGGEPDGAEEHMHAVEPSGSEEGGAVRSVGDGEGGGGVLEVLIAKEEDAEGQGHCEKQPKGSEGDMT